MKKRILLLLASFLCIYLINFMIPRLMPGDPFDYESAAAGEENTETMSEEMKAYLRSYYGLDQPLSKQLVRSIKDSLKGDLGDSIHYKRPVSEILLQRLPWTLIIMGSTLVLSLLLGTALSLLCVRRRGADRLLYPLMAIFAEIPPYLLGLLLLFLVAAQVKVLPLSGAVTAFGLYYTEWDYIKDVLLHALLPVTALTIVTIPRFFFTARASFLRILEKPYILNARAKGLREAVIRWRYIFVNALPPIAARFFLNVGSTVAGTLLIENVFAYPGLGLVMRESVKYRDYPMIQGVFLLSTIIVLLSLLAADLIGTLSGGKAGESQ